MKPSRFCSDLQDPGSGSFDHKVSSELVDDQELLEQIFEKLDPVSNWQNMKPNFINFIVCLLHKWLVVSTCSH